MTIKIEKTDRGFIKGTFEDRYGKKCSIQASSLASEPAIWLGCEEGDHVRDELGKEVCLARMHLTQDMVADLIPLLDHFFYTGKLVEEKYEAWINVEIEVASDVIEVRSMCLGLFKDRDAAIEGLKAYASYKFGEYWKWNGFHIEIEEKRFPRLMGYSGGYLHKHGEPKR